MSNSAFELPEVLVGVLDFLEGAALVVALVSKACAAHVRSNAGPGLEHSRLSLIMDTPSTAKWLLEEMSVEAVVLQKVSARTARLEVLQWLRAQNPPCPWSWWTCDAAAGSGHLEVLQWLRAEDPPCPWNEDTC